MLEIKNLKAGYNKIEILKDIVMNVKPGEIVAIIGPNGAGKSTLLKSIFNLCEINSGKIIFKDKDITKFPTYDLIYEGISFVPQGRQVFNDLTVRENLEMGAFVFNDRKVVETNMDEIFKKFPMLKEKQNEYAYTLSGGQQQILAISRALMQNPQLLLMDEPSLGLSPKAMKEIFKIIQEISKEGITIILVEQNAKAAVSICSRTYVLEGGKIGLSGGKEILKDKRIRNIYFGGE
jgi:branched-chain amino acid transport system ATP-binding protein